MIPSMIKLLAVEVLAFFESYFFKYQYLSVYRYLFEFKFASRPPPPGQHGYKENSRGNNDYILFLFSPDILPCFLAK